MKNRYITFLILIFFTLFSISCSKDAVLEEDSFVVAFESQSINLQNITTEGNIVLIYSKEATESGSVTIELSENNAIYGVDYETLPSGETGSISISISAGEIQNSITFIKLNPDLAGEETFIKLNITEINYSGANVQGNSLFTINSSAALGGSFEPELGGPNEGNQVFVDFSNQITTSVQRDSWDLGFYSGDHFRVSINGSIFMAVKALDLTDIDAVTEGSVADIQAEVAVGTFDPANAAYVDAPNGNITETAIVAIAENDSDNNVYLVNMGYAVSILDPAPGSVIVAGDFRGWKKIRILRNEAGYLLQYANLNDTSHNEIVIGKDSDYNFTHFSFNTETTVAVEPEKDKWDLCFTTFTNLIEGNGSYGYSDFVLHNRKGGVLSYEVNTSSFTYDAFMLSDVANTSFTEDQTTIGSNWRSVFEGGSVYDNVFYILKDTVGNIYKLRFLALVNEEGIRGYPEFEFSLLEETE